jgi:hypothetical protein
MDFRMHDATIKTIEFISERTACVTPDSGYAELHQETVHCLL